MNKENILFVIEGESREMDIVKNICNVFFKNTQIKIIPIPAGENIYMLWKKLKEDEFETDLLELLKENKAIDSSEIDNMQRDDFSEVYLFFDYDGHQDNLSNKDEDEKILALMLETFNNETENGLLYISYPMVEAIRDIIIGECRSIHGCTIEHNEIGNYKYLSSQSETIKNQSKFDIEDWREIINIFALKVSCLYGFDKVMEYEKYKTLVSPKDVYMREKKWLDIGKVFIISAFPQFLLDYHKFSFWHNMIKRVYVLKDRCEKNSEYLQRLGKT